MRCLIQLFFATPRRTLLWIAIGLSGMLLFGLYLQNVVGLHPCPMCVVTRYCFVLTALAALGGAVLSSRAAHACALALVGVFSVCGAFVSARQSWLQWYPPEFSSCGRDFYGMIEQLPLSRAIPQFFSGDGDCSQIDWTFLGGSIANWAFLCFVSLIVVSTIWLFALYKAPRGRQLPRH
ncbi:MAG: disulfide bond formation protein B [Brachymonas sp.]|nr:disulfide bond formation protein B [Brachymonas sp.]